MKLSIIIPVYRVESTLDRCLESVTGQTFTDMEIILVDDGSPDRCPQLCDDWAHRDHRIYVIHKKNGGLSDARNAGLDVARGELITFVDSDDFLDTNTYAQTVPMAEHSDIVEFPVYRFWGASWQNRLNMPDKTYNDMQDYWLQGKAYEHTYAWNKIYKRELFDGTRFPKGKVFEDVATLPLLLQKAKSVTTTSSGLYYYCQNENGITATAKGTELEMLLEAHLRVIDKWCDPNYYLHVLNIQMDVCELTGHAPTLTYRLVNPLVKSLTTKQRTKALTQNILGLKGICKLNKTLHQWKHSHS